MRRRDRFSLVAFFYKKKVAGEICDLRFFFHLRFAGKLLYCTLFISKRSAEQFTTSLAPRRTAHSHGIGNFKISTVFNQLSFFEFSSTEATAPDTTLPLADLLQTVLFFLQSISPNRCGHYMASKQYTIHSSVSYQYCIIIQDGYK